MKTAGFTEIASLSGTYNDIAYATDGSLFGLYNNGASLVTFIIRTVPSPRWRH